MQKIIILDFGSQTTQLIGRRLRELDTFCEILPYNKFPKDDPSVIGVILSGSPYSVHDPEAFQVDLSQFVGKVPVLGICYGAQYISHKNGGKVEQTGTREYGRANLATVDTDNPLFRGFDKNSQVWMSHGDTITAIPSDCKTIASTSDVKFAAYASTTQPLWAVQFHPEVFHSLQGKTLLKNFVVDICGSKQEWSPASYVETTVKELKEQLGNDRVILGLSGGVDSSVCATLLNRAIGKNLTCIFVDHGMLRKNEFAKVMEAYEGLGLNIESLSITGMVIKSHHNVGGLPKEMDLKLCEPLQWLFKDEVRRVGYELGMPERLIKRHPFPGPGLAVRILGDITREKVRILQDADDIYIENMQHYVCEDGEVLYDKVWQAGTVLLSTIRSVGVMGDERTYEHPVALRAVTSTDAMSADWAQLPYDFMAKVSNEIINKVKGVNRVCYDISSKPPATIEWE